jgi:hypothetical protein
MKVSMQIFYGKTHDRLARRQHDDLQLSISGSVGASMDDVVLFVSCLNLMNSSINGRAWR